MVSVRGLPAVEPCKISLPDCPGHALFPRPTSSRDTTKSWSICVTSLQGLPYTFCYLDDVLVTRPTLEQHLEHLLTIFEWLDSNGLILHPEKCAFIANPSHVPWQSHESGWHYLQPEPHPTHDTGPVMLSYYYRFLARCPYTTPVISICLPPLLTGPQSCAAVFLTPSWPLFSAAHSPTPAWMPDWLCILKPLTWAWGLPWNSGMVGIVTIQLHKTYPHGKLLQCV